jgi:hypothetical protein
MKEVWKPIEKRRQRSVILTTSWKIRKERNINEATLG